MSLLVFIAVQRDDINALNPMKVNRLAAHIRVFFSESVQGRVQRRPRPRPAPAREGSAACAGANRCGTLSNAAGTVLSSIMGIVWQDYAFISLNNTVELYRIVTFEVLGVDSYFLTTRNLSIRAD